MESNGVESSADPIVLQNQESVVNNNSEIIAPQLTEDGESQPNVNHVVEDDSVVQQEENMQLQENQDSIIEEKQIETEKPVEQSEPINAVIEEDIPLVIPKKRERKLPENFLTTNNYYGDLSLKNLQILLDKLFIPIIGFEEAKPKTETAKHISMDFTTNLKKFDKHVSIILQQLSGEVNLDIPNVTIDDPKIAMQDEGLCARLEAALLNWTQSIRVLIEKTNSKEREEGGPLSEIEYWRQRQTDFGTVYEQLMDPNVKKMKAVLEKYDFQMLPGYEDQFQELAKFYMEAKDNVKFLSTLERHFKTIASARDSLLPISDSLLSMMSAIRMVWVVSRHYNTEKRMTILLALIADEIADKVGPILLQKLRESSDILQQWKLSYNKTKEKLETSKKDGDKWDFDREKLFGRTDYMYDICQDLFEVVSQIIKYQRFLGPDLQRVTGDYQGVDSILLLVKELVEPFVAAKYDVFDRRANRNWSQLMQQFRSSVEVIKEHINKYIEESFQKLKSAEAALKLLQDVQTIQAQEKDSSSKRNSLVKVTDILDRFSGEIDVIEEVFLKERDDPPKAKNLPPVSSIVYWADSLFQKIKKPAKLLQASEELFQPMKFKQVQEKSVRVGKLIKEFENKVFNQWKQDVVENIVFYLKQNILAQDTDRRSYVNFNPNLMLIIQETKYLDKLGKKVPEIALNITLQEDKYHNYIEGLKHIFETLNHATANLDSSEKAVLEPTIQKLFEILKPGFDVLNWNSLGIEAFIKKCNVEVMNLQNIVKKLKKNASIIFGLIHQIKTSSLIKDFPVDSFMEIQEVYQKCEDYRNDQMKSLLKKYSTISQSLLRIEGDLISANVITDKKTKEASGRAIVLIPYYQYWERKIFQALTKLIVNSFQQLHGLFNLKRTKQKNPFILVVAQLSHNMIIKSPPIEDLSKMIGKLMNLVLDATKLFIRWMDGTCVEVSNLEIKEGDRVKSEREIEDLKQVIQNNFSFYKDIINLEKVTKMQAHLLKAVNQNSLRRVQEYVDRYMRFESYWRIPKEMAIEKFAAKNPTWEDYDNKLEEYSKLIKDIQIHSKPIRDIDFIRVDCSLLLQQIQEEAAKWITALLKLLNDNIRPKLQKLNDEIVTFREQIQKPIMSIDDLRNVLKIIDNIKVRSIGMERDYREVEDCYNTLITYKFEVSFEEKKLADNIQEKWRDLVEIAKTVGESLAPEIKKFTAKTKSQVEELLSDLSKLLKEFDEGPGDPRTPLDKGLELLKAIKVKVEEKRGTRDYLVSSERLFGLDITPFKDMYELEEKISTVGKVYSLYEDWKERLDKWAKQLWEETNLEEMQKVTTEFVTRLNSKQEFPKNIQKLSTYNIVKDNITSFQTSLPLFEMLKNKALRKRHWEQLMQSTGVNFDINPETFTFQNLVDLSLYKYSEEIERIFVDAKAELRTEETLAKLADDWRGFKFELKKHERDGKDRGFVIATIEEIKEALDEGTMELQGFSGARHALPFLEEIGDWEKRLARISEITELWIEVQRQWMYLELIFIGSDDIREQLPEQAKAFDKIDQDWSRLMNETSKNRNVLEICKDDRKLDLLKSLQQRLQVCQKGLSNYLQTKRDAFPRFFFISDDDLLDILGSSDPKKVQKHMKKMFDNCDELVFKPETNIVLGMKSSEGESFHFAVPVQAEGAVEKWLLIVSEEMRRSLRSKSKEAVFYYPKQARLEWIKSYLGMVTLVGSQIWWTWEVEDSFRRVKKGDKIAVKTLASKLTKQLNDLVDAVRTPLDYQSRKKITTQIIIDVHARDIVDGLVRDSILDEREFEWESQLRFYWDKQVDDILIRQCTGEFRYGYEYEGLNGRLVITPLTDRCFMTLTQALTFNLGGSPAGPAGTGKTESVKDLAKSMAIMCVVFNCGEGLDYKAMHTIFAGLCQAGAWGCFDEFNRIELPVLSVVSTQIRSIQTALKARLTRFRFEDEEINLDGKTGIFITMNPGYAGRVELPDNLKVMFRPCVMVVPDMEIICENMLLSEGFNSARILARKMTKLYSLAQGQLSKQNHYDWGLRALKACLVVAGRLKREALDQNEDDLLMRAMYDMNAPKFIFEDTPLFEDLLNDLFVNLRIEKKSYPSLQKQIEQFFVTNQYQVIENQIDKVIQLYETMNTRHSVMIVGGTCGGKTVVLRALAYAQTKLGLPTSIHTINPKAQPVSELYGTLEEVSRDWHDGVLSRIYRQINQKTDKGEERRYLLFDGDVDAVWIENMNSVMDDNKLLTLPNGDRIELLYPQSSLLFEVGDLQYASPATVSRCGMVYVDPKNLGFKPYIWKWLTDNFETARDKKELYQTLFDRYLEVCINYVLDGEDLDGTIIAKKLKNVISVNSMSLTMQFCSVLSSLLQLEQAKNLSDERDIEAAFIFALYWGIGGVISDSDRGRFDAFAKRVMSNYLNPKDNDNLDQVVSSGSFPTKLTLYEYFFDFPAHCWRAWKQIVPKYEKPADGKFSSILVPTVETVRYSFLLENLIKIQQPVLFVGAAGTAKTVIIQNYLKRTVQATPDKVASLNINLSSRTSSLDVQRTIEDNIEQKFGDTYGPFSGKTLNIFIDDLNMPRVDTYGTQQPIALLKLLFEKKGMYDRGGSLEFKKIKDIQFICAMAPPGGGRNAVDPRFLSKFTSFNINFPSEDSLIQIYSSILMAHVDIFSGKIKSVAEKLTSITLNLYNQIVLKLPPTPSKFHYVFNLRDLSRVYEGLCLSTVDKFETAVSFVRLWRNECMRVFHDRLITKDDKEFVISKIQELIAKNFADVSADALKSPVVFGDFLRMFDDEPVRLYEDVTDYNRIKPIVEENLKLFNESNQKKMNLVMFDDALEHLTRIIRIIRMNRGHALLVGVGGSGKQSLTKLAAFIAGYEVFELTITRGYGETQFRDDLKALYTKLGIEGKKIVFLFTDAHVVDNGFLEFINNMLTTGMVPALFADEEKDQLISNVMKEVKEQNMVQSKENCWNYFVDKARDNLHIVLAMSPAGDTLRIRCRNFPGLVNNTSIDWFTPWPAEALQEVAKVFLEDEKLPEDLKKNVVDHMVFVHLSVTKASEEFEHQLKRHNYVTPKNYLDYISTYKNLLKENLDRIDFFSKRFEVGLGKLLDAKSEVEALKQELSEAKVIVAEKSVQNEQLLVQIEFNTTEAEKKKAQAQEAEATLSVDFETITKEKEEAEAELAAAKPALEEALLELNNLKPGDIVELKSMANPTEPVRDVCACVSILLSKTPVDGSWKTSKAVMSDASFITKLLSFVEEKKAEQITKAKMSQIKEYYKKHGSLFKNVDEMKSKSVAAAGLLTWVNAVKFFYEVLKTVEPKQRNVQNAEKTLKAKQEELENTKNLVIELESQLTSLQEQLQSGQKIAKELKEKADVMERKLNAANRLIDGLSSERVRWANQIEAYKQERIELTGNSLVAAAFLSYTGAFTVDFRKRIVYEMWYSDLQTRKIPIAPNFKVGNLLTNEVEISQWETQGLPSDEVSIQNGILTTRASRFPLCIDPQLQAVAWIKNKEDQLEVTNFNDPNFMRKVEQAIKNGKTILFENVDEYIDPMLDPILQMNVKGKNRSIKLNGEDIYVDDKFKLYLCTRLSNPHYSPEVAGKTMIINYSVTENGLQDQLLNAVVKFERPELEESRKKLVQTMSENKALLKKLEEKILQELNMSGEGSLIENMDLILTLEDTKQKVSEINRKLEESVTTSADIERARQEYRSVAKRGSILYFVMASLVNINSMYEYSLSSFMNDVFDVALAKSDPSSAFERRLENIINYLTYSAYTYTCNGLFEEHKLTFSFQLTIKIMEGEGLIDTKELDFFLKGNISLEKPDRENNFAWISEQGWKDLLLLQEINPVFENIVADLESDEAQWKQWYDLEMPENVEIPMGYSEKLTSFQQLCVLKCFRIDRILRSVVIFISKQMGSDKFVKPPVLDYGNIYKQSNPFSPIVCMISPGYDPANDILKLSEKLDKRCKYISLGQGQDVKAEVMLKKGLSKGHWVLLQNCHLLVKWMKNVEKILDEVKKDKVHNEFRLWLTTEVSPDFPIGILQKSLKVVTEPPNSLLLNMISTYAKITDDMLEDCPHQAFRPLVYVLAFFHAVLQDRRKFGKIGWNVPYDFNRSDFDVSFSLMKLYLTKAVIYDDPVPWESLKYLVGEAMYGGRVTDFYDRRVLTTYLNEYMGDFLFDIYQPFFFYKDEKTEYSLPENSLTTAYSKDQYEKYIETHIPLNSNPEVFGLHPNAEISYLTNATKALWKNLLELQSRAAGSSAGISREEFISKVASNILERVPEPFDRLAIKNKIGTPNPIQVVLLQEIERWNKLVTKMRTTLVDLQRALEGEIGMSNELDELSFALYNGQVPDSWRPFAPATKKSLSGWLDHFQRRYNQYNSWIEQHSDPIVIWLSGLHIPESYLTAIVQMTCKKYKWPLDRTTLFTRVTKYTDPNEILRKPNDGCYVQGLYMEGAAWDLERSCLRRQDPKVLVVELPVLEVIPVENSKLKLQNTFKVPVYVTSNRRNAGGVGLVFEADLATEEHKSHWILTGTCLYLNKD